MQAPQFKKRKIQHHHQNKLKEIIKACLALQDDSDKINLLVGYIKQLDIEVPHQHPSIKKEDTLKLLSAFNIKPKERDRLLFEIFEDNAYTESGNAILDCYYSFTDKKTDLSVLMENVKKAAALLSKATGETIQATHILSLLSSWERLDVVMKGYTVGDVVVSGAISSLLEVICSINGHFQDGDKQIDINLDDELPVFHVRNDGTISEDPSSIPYLLREDKSFDQQEHWENDHTDAFKLILSMKSTLREKIKQEHFIKEERKKYSKVLGLNYLQRTAHLLLLELDLEEKDNDIIPTYYLSNYSYYITEIEQIIPMWLTILKYSIEFVPKRKTYGKNYLPTALDPPSKNLSQIPEIFSSVLSTRSRKSSKPQTKLHKKVISCYESDEEQRCTYKVLGTTFMKKVTEEEMSIIIKLVELDNFSPYLPRILNVYKDIVEFEELESLPRSNLTEEMIMDLVVDISKALHFLHSNQIIHRDVKPANIMIRNFHNHCTHQFVLIDFGLSFSFYKKDNICFDYDSRKAVQDNAGTECFKAPEVNDEETSYDEKIDIYSLGASIVYLMNSGKSSENWQHAINGIEWKCLKFKELVLNMLDIDTNKRPSALDIFQQVATLQPNTITPRTFLKKVGSEFWILLE